MRWQIAESKKRIYTTEFEGHTDDVEMSGECVSGIVKYGVREGCVQTEMLLVYPMIRLQPDETSSAYRITVKTQAADFKDAEIFEKAELDGVLSIYAHAGDINIVHRFYPSITLPVFYERIEMSNAGDTAVRPVWSEYAKLDGRIACEGWAYAERTCDSTCVEIEAGGTATVTFAYSARFANEEIPRESDPLSKRRARVAELMSQCDLTTGNDTVDTMFAFAKLRAGESIFRTRKGRIHSPGGGSYYAGVWCNDQCEYATPWFGFTGDANECEATENAMRLYAPFMNDEYEPIPSSIISEGTDYWNGRRDRGDAAMYLYGNSRYFLERGELPDAERQKMLAWAAEYTLRQINSDNVVVSDTDELEFRLSSGINLATSCIAYGAFELYACILRRLNERDAARRITAARERVAQGIEFYFGAELKGCRTYRYHEGCEEIRAWNCLPAYMGTGDRKAETARLIDAYLWENGSCRSTENENIMWDRSALFFIVSLFRSGDADRGWKKLCEFAQTRLLGDRVPYAVEAYPEHGMRHLSAESALFCRTVTDGLLDIKFDEKGAYAEPHLPKELQEFAIKNIWLDGGYKDVCVKNGKVFVTAAGNSAT